MDLSEIQLNFELEESEMRIFSEDETLLSTFDSASVMSQGSPHINANILPRDRHGRSSLGVNLHTIIQYLFNFVMCRQVL